jgi:hypothetical protein
LFWGTRSEPEDDALYKQKSLLARSLLICNAECSKIGVLWSQNLAVLMVQCCSFGCYEFACPSKKHARDHQYISLRQFFKIFFRMFLLALIVSLRLFKCLFRAWHCYIFIVYIVLTYFHWHGIFGYETWTWLIWRLQARAATKTSMAADWRAWFTMWHCPTIFEMKKRHLAKA